MLDVKELRVGNYVTDGKNGISKISELRNYKGRIGYTPLDFNNYVFTGNEIYPIPLNEEWLLRFGFRQDGEGWFWLRRKDDITVLGYSYNIYGKFFELCEIRIPNIIYVHQLQNLYFALTGEELTLKNL